MKKLLNLLISLLMTCMVVGCSTTETKKVALASHVDTYVTSYEGQKEYLSVSTDIIYDENNNIIGSNSSVYDENGNLKDSYTTARELDENGNSIYNECIYASNTDESFEATAEYDSKNREVEGTTTYGNGNTELYVYEYPDDTHYNYDYYENDVFVFSRTCEETYDSNGKKIKTVWQDSNEDSPVIITYEYNDAGKEVYRLYMQDDKVAETDTTTYDEDGNKLETYKVETHDGIYGTERKVYTYTVGE